MSPKSGVVVGGMPTEMDVKRIEETLGSLKQGDMVPYERLEELLSLRRTSNRFKSIVGAWRRKLERSQNLLIKAEMNKGYRVCTNPERVEVCARAFSLGIRSIGKTSTRARATERVGLTAEEVKTIDFVQNISAHLHLHAATEKRKLSLPDPNVKALASPV